MVWIMSGCFFKKKKKMLYLGPWGYFGGTGVLWAVGPNVEGYIGQETHLRVRVLSAQQLIGWPLPFLYM